MTKTDYTQFEIKRLTDVHNVSELGCPTSIRTMTTISADNTKAQ